MANFNYNRFEFAGRIAADLEIKMTMECVSFLNFPIAITRRYAIHGKRESDFIRLTAWGDTAEFIAKYFTKGSSIFVTGEVRSNTYTTPDGEKRYSTDFIVDEVEFIDSKRQSLSASAQENAKTDDSEVSEDNDFPF